MYCWATQNTQTLALLHAEIGDFYTTMDWYNYCREICALVINDEDVERIGGVGKIVEIDESKFGKRKYNRGRRVEGQWVFEDVERGSNNVFLTCVLN